MNRIAPFFLPVLSLFVTLSFSTPAFTETMRCAECGMMVDAQSKFSARIVQEGASLSFCDIGDMFSYLKRKGLQQAGAQVQDYMTGKWIDARKASYVHSEKKFRTPMGWGVAAFEESARASEYGSAMDFDAMAKALK